MGRIAFVFSGQGDQYAGMGKELYDTNPVAKQIMDKLESMREGTIRQCFEGTPLELRQTSNAQPCLFAMEMAGAKVLESMGIKPSAVAGFSLGEVVAITYANSVSMEQGFELVCERGKIMQAEAEKHNATMVAVVKLSADQVRDTASKYTKVYPVNFNCPGNVSVAGDSEQLKAFGEDVKALGGRAIPIYVAGAFHSPLMEPASRQFAEVLRDVDMQTPSVDVYANLTAKPYDDEIKDTLSRQIANPVLWEDSIRNMIDAGIDTFIEIGPGKTLSNMIAKISADVKVYCIKDMQKIIDEVK